MIIRYLSNNGINGYTIIILLAYLVVILTAIVLHELSHGYAAYFNGDMTAKNTGRLSLNPMKHLTLVGTLLLLLVGFGFARPVPIDPRNFREYKKGMIMTSLAGVTMNFILALINSICLVLLLKFGQMTFENANFAYYATGFAFALFYYGMFVNILLMVFNLLPLYPLDGFRVVETLADPDNKYVNFMYKYGNFVLLGFILLSYLLSWFNIPDIFDMVQDLARMVFNAIWGGIGVSI
ncbi:MAG: site-2 protease family protein [Clostridia bacterium]|nr:site-2 protease family protein [Clostridia bacterium]